MKNYFINATNHLLMAGEIDKKTYIAIYKVVSYQEYKCISSETITDGAGANSFAYVEINDKKYIGRL
ncbi:MAG: hypothetical protein LUG26_07185 [Ruminococcus sp.]|nr:hypothetical protein [Ruminococcus sp.]